STSFPFGIWFANATTLYVADEGNGTTGKTAATFYDPAKAQTTAGLQKWVLDHRSLSNYTTNVSSILYFQRKTIGSALISSKYRWMRSISSCLLVTRIPRNIVRVILLN